MTRKEAERLYHATEGIIGRLASRFATKYGGDAAELEADGNLLFIKAVNGYDPPRASFKSHLFQVLNSGWIDRRRQELHRQSILRQAPMPKEVTGSEVKSPLWELSDHAQTAIKLVVEIDFRYHRDKRGFVRRLLADLGWSVEQIQKTFEEVRDALI